MYVLYTVTKETPSTMIYQVHTLCTDEVDSYGALEVTWIFCFLFFYLESVTYYLVRDSYYLARKTNCISCTQYSKLDWRCSK